MGLDWCLLGALYPELSPWDATLLAVALLAVALLAVALLALALLALALLALALLGLLLLAVTLSVERLNGTCWEALEDGLRRVEPV